MSGDLPSSDSEPASRDNRSNATVAPGPDPVATPTLARLYLRQGHPDRARSVLEDRLRQYPFDGKALALCHRLDALQQCTVGLHVLDAELEISWGTVVNPGASFVVLFAYPQTRPWPSTWITSTRCQQSAGRWRLQLPFERASACACVGALATHGGFIVTGISRPISWP